MADLPSAKVDLSGVVIRKVSAIYLANLKEASDSAKEIQGPVAATVDAVKELTAVDAVKELTAVANTKEFQETVSAVKELSTAVANVKDVSNSAKEIKETADAVKELSTAAANIKDVSSAATAVNEMKETVAAVKELSEAVVKDLSGVAVAAVAVVERGKSYCSYCFSKAKPTVKEQVLEKSKTTDLSGVVAEVVKELSAVSVDDVILALPRLLEAAKEAGAADNSELVKLKHSARTLLSQCVKDDRAASAFADTYLHAVCAALLGSSAKAVPAVSVVEKKVTSGGRSWFVCWKR